LPPKPAYDGDPPSYRAGVFFGTAGLPLTDDRGVSTIWSRAYRVIHYGGWADIQKEETRKYRLQKAKIERPRYHDVPPPGEQRGIVQVWAGATEFTLRAFELPTRFLHHFQFNLGYDRQFWPKLVQERGLPMGFTLGDFACHPDYVAPPGGIFAYSASLEIGQDTFFLRFRDPDYSTPDLLLFLTRHPATKRWFVRVVFDRRTLAPEVDLADIAPASVDTQQPPTQALSCLPGPPITPPQSAAAPPVVDQPVRQRSSPLHSGYREPADADTISEGITSPWSP